MRIKYLITVFVCVLSQGHSRIPEPYCSLNTFFPYDESGWYINAVPMEKILRESNVMIAIELGSWLGQSTRHIASHLPEGGVIFAVDHWLGSDEVQGSHQHLIPHLYDKFLSNVIHANLTHKIIPMRMTTLEAAEEFKRRKIIPDLVYVDASHDEASVYADLEAYYPLVRGHGILCGDDWSAVGGEQGFPVRRAVERFAKDHHLTILLSNGWFWRLYE